ncbi:MAG: hypothetical protein V4671_29415 [Armatimonadota bacterium]
MRLPLVKILVVGLFAIPLGAREFVKLQQYRHATARPLALGQIIRREDIRLWGDTPANQLTIQPTGTQGEATTVRAQVSNKEMDSLPTEICYYHSGNPEELAFPENTESPLLPLLFLWGGPPVAFVLVSRLLRIR